MMSLYIQRTFGYPGNQNHFVIIGMEFNWFKSYLTKREQQCIINDQLSSKKIITCGVPQGSILGPFLFLLYFNDLRDCLKLTTPCMYADDTQIFASSYNANELILKLNSDLAQVLKRLIKNKLQMHLSILIYCLLLQSE